jgi:hypothetical protein
MANTCRPVLAAPVRRLQPSTSFAAVNLDLTKNRPTRSSAPSRRKQTVLRATIRSRNAAPLVSCHCWPTRSRRGYRWTGVRSPPGRSSPCPVHRFHREPEQSPELQTELAFARTAPDQTRVVGGDPASGARVAEKAVPSIIPTTHRTSCLAVDPICHRIRCARFRSLLDQQTGSLFSNFCSNPTIAPVRR